MDYKTIGEIIAIAGGIISIAGVIPVVTRHIIRQWHRKGRYMSEYAKHSFFYPLSFAKKILRKNIELAYGESEFINYASALVKNYYSDDVTKIKLMIGKIITELDLPYKEIINYITHPEASTAIKDRCIDSRFELGKKYLELTQANFDDFVRAKPKTTDGPALRLQSLRQVEGDKYECVLQSAGYFDQVRTNLSLDYPIDLGRSMRTEDLTNNKQLKPLHESILANTIGVSAIWVTPRKHRGKKLQYQVFLRPRSRQTGVFYDMLGTVSGVVEPPANDEFAYDTLEEYAKKEITREFYEETGYNEYMVSKSLPENKIKVVPLAFTRELIRGGKPQFFFLIITPEISDTELSIYFKKSFNGAEEFRNNIDSRIINYRMSPETQTNFLYALAYIQRFEKLEYIDLND